jgi:hypothetical protein
MGGLKERGGRILFVFFGESNAQERLAAWEGALYTRREAEIRRNRGARIEGMKTGVPGGTILIT